MTLASRPARVTLPPAQATGPAAALRSDESGLALRPSLLGLGLGTRLAMAGAALACLWSAVALGML